MPEREWAEIAAQPQAETSGLALARPSAEVSPVQHAGAAAVSAEAPRPASEGAEAQVRPALEAAERQAAAVAEEADSHPGPAAASPSEKAEVSGPRTEAAAVRRPVAAAPGWEAGAAPRAGERAAPQPMALGAPEWGPEADPALEALAAVRRPAGQRGSEAAARLGLARRLGLGEARIVRAASALQPAAPGYPGALPAGCRRSLLPIARASWGSERRRRARPHGARSRSRQRAGGAKAGGAAAARGRGRRASQQSRRGRVRRC
jgi:hypothetical protein